MEGVKHDHEKLRWSLLPLKTLESVVRVLMSGAKKYADSNWKIVVADNPDRYYNALMRHLSDYQAGVRIDEDGEPTMAHIISCAIFLLWNDERRNNEDHN